MNECPRCNHPNDQRIHTRTILDRIRRRPGRWVCNLYDPDDIGNGMAGGERCPCRGSHHQPQ